MADLKRIHCKLTRLRPRVEKRGAFTLIEILVVVAIIALLVAILLPALRNAREQSRIAVCMVNCKQIGTMNATYQGEFRGYLPVLYNYGEGIGHANKNIYPARNMWLSVAYRRYSRVSRTMPVGFDAFRAWTVPTRQAWEDNYMDAFFGCPFIREKGKGNNSNPAASLLTVGTLRIGSQLYSLQDWQGRHNSYVTWIAEGRQIRNVVPPELGSPPVYMPPDQPGQVNAPTDGRPKYSSMSYNFGISSGAYTPPPGFSGLLPSAAGPAAGEVDPMNNRHRQWNPNEARRLKAASLSEVTVDFCFQGQNMGFGAIIRNMGSHRRNGTGGAPAVFADSHIEWVRGFQIGWQ